MSAVDEQKVKLQRRADAIVAGAVLGTIALISASYGFVILPMLRLLVAGGEYDVAPLNDRLAHYQTFYGKLTTFSKQIDGLDASQQDRLAALVPDNTDVPGLFSMLEGAAAKDSFIVSSIDTSTDDKQPTAGGRKILHIAMTVTGGNYQQFKSFLARVESLPRVIDVNGISITPGQPIYAMNLEAYYFTPVAAAQ